MVCDKRAARRWCFAVLVGGCGVCQPVLSVYNYGQRSSSDRERLTIGYTVRKELTQITQPTWSIALLLYRFPRHLAKSSPFFFHYWYDVTKLIRTMAMRARRSRTALQGRARLLVYDPAPRNHHIVVRPRYEL